MLIAIAACGNDADDISGGDSAKDFEYYENSNSITITKYKGAGGNVTIPSKINGKPVTSLNDWGTGAFENCTSVTSVTIPNSVTDIGGAFENCINLTSVIIGSSVTNMTNAFLGCRSLTSVTIPNSVTIIGVGTFENCTSLTNVTIPNSVTYIADSTFRNCISLTSITIPNGVTNIEGYWAFDGCTSLTSVTFQGTITSDNFSNYSSFPGDLRDKYLANGQGTYTRAVGSNTWTKV